MNKKEPPVEKSRARELLRRERERIEKALADLSRVRDSDLEEIDTETNPLDNGETIEDEEVDETLAEQRRAELEAVERAEKRLEEGSYGFSVESGEPIPPERLETIPWAERTAAEQERYEQIHGRAL